MEDVIEEMAIRLYDFRLKRERLLYGRDGESFWLPKTSPDSRLLAAGVRRPNPGVRLWEVVTGKELFFKGSEGEVGRGIAWSPNGRLLAIGNGRWVTREMHQNGLNQILWLKINRDIAQTIMLVDSATGAELARFGGFKTDVVALSFAPNGNSLVAG